jgi:hypothetical protein
MRVSFRAIAHFRAPSTRATEKELLYNMLYCSPFGKQKEKITTKKSHEDDRASG